MGVTPHSDTKKKPVGFFGSFWTLVVAVLLAGFFAFSLPSMYRAYERANEARFESQMAYDELVIKYNDLEEDLGTLSSEQGIEKALRERYRVVRDGEEVVVFVEHDPLEGAFSADVSEHRMSWWKRLFGFLRK